MGAHFSAQEFRALTNLVVQASDPRVRNALVRIEPLARQRQELASAESLEFFRQIGEGLTRLRGFAQADLRTSCLKACSYYLFLTGHAREALVFAEHGLELARRSSRVSEIRLFHTLLGTVFGELGVYTSAIHNIHRALELSIECCDLRGETISWNNLSALLLDSGMYVEAISAGRRALKLIEGLGDDELELRARCETNLALSLHRLGESQAALQYAVNSIASSHPPSNGRQAQGRIIRESNIVEILLELGDVSGARVHASAAVSFANAFPNDRSTTVALIGSALVKVYAGDSIQGIQELENLLADRTIQELPPLHLEVLGALVRAYQVLGRNEEALLALDNLLSHFSRIGVATVLQQLDSFRDGGIGAPPHVSKANHRVHELEIARLRQKVAEREMLDSRIEMLERMAIAADIREDISGEHGFRVGRLSALLAREIGWERDACEALGIAARLHDIGKFGIPEKILLDEKTLRDAERQFIEVHTRVGAEILSRSDIPQVRIAEEIARDHHEWWDGSGYPRQLKGMDIPRGARIVALADVFDAITHGRPYAPPRSIEEALDIIAGLRGRQFDPELTDHFLALVRRLARENKDLDAFLGKAARHSPFLKARARIKELLAQERDSNGLSPSPRPPGVSLN